MAFWDLALIDETMVNVFSKTILECCLCGNYPIFVKLIKMCTGTELRKNQTKKKVRKTIKQVIYISPKHACLLYPIIERNNRIRSEKKWPNRLYLPKITFWIQCEAIIHCIRNSWRETYSLPDQHHGSWIQITGLWGPQKWILLFGPAESRKTLTGNYIAC